MEEPDGTSRWAKVASSNLEHLSRTEAEKMLVEAGHGAGMAIVLGNILDTIPGCLVIGAKFADLATLSIRLILGMFIGGIPEAAASASMLKRAGYRPFANFALWSAVLVAGSWRQPQARYSSDPELTWRFSRRRSREARCLPWSHTR